MSRSSEIKRLEEIGARSSYAAGVNALVTKYSYHELRHYVFGNILELGPAEGIMTSELVADGHKPLLLEGSESLSKLLQIKFPDLEIETNLFENFESTQKFDVIIMGHVLEHVIDPVNILNKFKSFLEPRGIIWASVPNAKSLHRQAAVEMGLISHVQELNEADQRHGHRRVFTPEEFRGIFELTGLSIVEFGGYWLKPLSNLQIEDSWTEEMVAAFCRLGKTYPEISGEMYVIASV